ncbi:hypothetical protein SynNOUM97013_00254 [Synechococcus sp. NOUM97013]|nr:hypothetical protein SynNOUM97013_00254 [Synechococcus sp. NOUM97013]
MTIAKEFGALVIYEKAGSMYKAINTGITAYPSKWITYINSDDKLNCNLATLINSDFINTYDIISGAFALIDSRSRCFHQRLAFPILFHRISYFVGGMPFPQSGTVISRDLYNRLNGFSLKYKYASDFDFFLRANLQNSKVFLSVKILSSFRLHEEQLSHVNNSAHLNEIRAILKYNTSKPSLFALLLFRCVYLICVKLFVRF